jgi:dimethylhistidine N-methyltransferase
VRSLLGAMRQPAGYLPIDISAEYLAQAATGLQHDHPRLVVRPLVADFTTEFDLPEPVPGVRRRIGFFPGSTIGNLSPPQALAFLRQAARHLRGGALLLGVDRIKAPELLHAAYNDAQGVTAAFNLNLLARANRELGCDFDLAHFSHSAFYNAGLQRVEMHLVSRCQQSVHLRGQRHELAEGDSLHTENSYKFSLAGVTELARSSGFEVGPVFSDPAGWFSLLWLVSP